MRVLAVADSVFAFCDIDGLVRHHLDVLSVQDAFLLLGHHVGDACLAGIEIVPDLLHFVGLAVIFHFRKAFYRSGRVFRAPCEYGLGLQVIFHIIGGKLHVAVRNGDIAVIVYHPFPVGKVFDDGVFGRRECRSFERTLPEKLHRIGPCYGISQRDGIPCCPCGIRKLYGIFNRLFYKRPVSQSVAP